MFWYKQGQPPAQAHKGIPDTMVEEEQGLEGFYGRVSHLIKKNPPTGWSKIECEASIRPYMFDLNAFDKGASAWGEGSFVLRNADVEVFFWRKPSFKEGDELVLDRHADGDVLLFCHKGQGLVLTEYGCLNFKKGVYVLIPKGLLFSVWHEGGAEGKAAAEFLVVKNLGAHFKVPDKGLVGQQALYDVGALEAPDLEKQHSFLKQKKLHSRKIFVRKDQNTAVFTFSHNLLDTVAWKGDLYPLALDTARICPLMSHRVHLPPSAHTTFDGGRDLVVCTFVPRPLEEDPDALKVPFYHLNIDYEEVIFYHDGDFFSRDNLHAGMMSYHPMGFTHGPHPKARRAVKNKQKTNEWAVMLDTRRSLTIGSCAHGCRVKDYEKSWQET